MIMACADAPHARFAPLLSAGLVACCGGCLASNPSYCVDDVDCSARAADKPLCHPLGHFCYSGCASDEACQNPALLGYSATTPQCDRETHHCVSTPRADAGIAVRGQGASCERDADCETDHCVDHVCCYEPCEEPCHTCATGECSAVPAGTCLEGCTSHSDCLATSLCDRREAHAQPGRGSCVDPAQIITVSATKPLLEAIGQASAALPFVRIPAGTHALNATVAGRPALLVGCAATAEDVVLTAATSGVPLLRVEGHGALALQGLTVQGATSGASAIVCSGGSALNIVEARVANNAHLGIESSSCDVTLRRDRILLNQGGGAKLVGGQLLLTDNLVASNGAPAVSSVGGLWLDPGSGGSICTNNTVANNVAKQDVAAGVYCESPLQLINAIVWGNGFGSACSFGHSNVEGGAAGVQNIAVDPLFFDPSSGDYTLQAGSLSIDAGDSTASGVAAIDLAGALRIQGTAIDQGAFER